MNRLISYILASYEGNGKSVIIPFENYMLMIGETNANDAMKKLQEDTQEVLETSVRIDVGYDMEAVRFCVGVHAEIEKFIVFYTNADFDKYLPIVRDFYESE